MFIIETCFIHAYVIYSVAADNEASDIMRGQVYCSNRTYFL